MNRPFQSERLIDQVWQDLSKTVPRPVVAETVTELLAKYDDASIMQYVPALVCRGAKEFLRFVHLTEIEARFRISDPAVIWQLQTCTELAGYTMSRSTTKSVWDTYLDTPEQRIHRAGFTCSQRETADGIRMTLKSLSCAEGAIHRRGEWEVAVAAGCRPAAWPESQVRERVLRLVGHAPLEPLISLDQVRVKRMLAQATQPVAELSMDSVTVVSGEETRVFHVLEVELLPAKAEENLTTIVDCLQEEWHLHPEPYSKFERALYLS
jgi:inorganic triphosphatase YgiF